MSPSEIRRARPRGSGETVSLEVGYRPPYDWDGILKFLGARAVPGVEMVDAGVYRRAVALGGKCGWIAVTQNSKRNSLRVEVSSGLASVIPQILRRVRRLFDTACEPEAISEALGELAVKRPGLRVPGAFDGFEAATRAILGQQITVTGARTLAGRMAARFGSTIETPHPELTTAFPSAETIGASDLDSIASLGIVSKRAKALIAIGQAVADRSLRLVPGSDMDSTVQQLCAFDGVGPWTAQYICMRALSYPDAFPHSDLGLMKALDTRDPAVVLEAGEQWRPWRAYAALHLWHSLEDKA